MATVDTIREIMDDIAIMGTMDGRLPLVREILANVRSCLRDSPGDDYRALVLLQAGLQVPRERALREQTLRPDEMTHLGALRERFAPELDGRTA